VVARPGDSLVRTPKMQTNCHALSSAASWLYQRVRSQLIHSTGMLTRGVHSAPAFAQNQTEGAGTFTPLNKSARLVD
jgi:hypothetical protein